MEVGVFFSLKLIIRWEIQIRKPQKINQKTFWGFWSKRAHKSIKLVMLDAESEKFEILHHSLFRFDLGILKISLF